MATIKEKGNRYYVIYSYRDIDGTRKQKWETCKTLAEAKHRKTEIEYKQNIGNLNIPACHTIDELITEYAVTDRRDDSDDHHSNCTNAYAVAIISANSHTSRPKQTKPER